MSSLSDRERAIRQKLKDDLEHYAPRCLKIRTKAGQTEPLNFNRAQHFIHSRLEDQKARIGRVRALILKGRQQGCCLAPETRVLTAKLRWRQIGDLVVGEEVVAVDEETSSRSPGVSGGGRGRKMRTATVEAVRRFRQQAYRVTLDDGRSVVTSGNHRWLVRKSQTQWLWRVIDDLRGDGRSGVKVGDCFRSITEPWGDPSLEDYWFGGLADGEGSFDCSESRTGVRLAVSQRAGPVLDRMEAHCRSRDYAHYIISDDGPRKTKHGQEAVHAVNLSNLGTMFRVMGLSRPARFVGKRWWEGKSMPDNGERRIVSIEPVGEMELVDIQTSTGTFIAEGFVSHNSTYVGARFYHRSTHSRGIRVFILTHEDAATQNLFEMVDRYHDHCPDLVKPSTGASSAKELAFDKLDSGYKVGTAGTKGVGRSSTIQLFHGSEVAFWPHADTHASGVLQAIPEAPGTEVILESTANGMGNLFHQMWQDAESGKSDFIPIFVPWYWQDEYRRVPPTGFSLDDEETEYAEAYGLDDEQMAWRRAKIVELKDPLLFKQEYPATAAEAFQLTGHDSYIPAALVLKARKAEKIKPYGPLVLGVDPAWSGDARSAIAARQGRVVLGVKTRAKLSTMELAGWVKQAIDEDAPERVFIDVGGVGAGVYDRLVEMGYGDVVSAVNFGSSPLEPMPLDEKGRPKGGPLNRRAEMWMKSKEWLEDPGGVSLPDEDSIQTDACGPTYSYDSLSRLKLEAKDHMQSRGVASPDEWDAIALTFAEPVAHYRDEEFEAEQTMANYVRNETTGY